MKRGGKDFQAQSRGGAGGAAEEDAEPRLLLHLLIHFKK